LPHFLENLAHRISKVLPTIVKEDQTGYVQGQYIGENIRLIMDIMRVTELESIPGLAIFIDFRLELPLQDIASF